MLQKNANFNVMFVRVGDNWEVPDDMFSDAEELICVLYGKPRLNNNNNNNNFIFYIALHYEYP